MFRLVVLSALLVAVVAESGLSSEAEASNTYVTSDEVQTPSVNVQHTSGYYLTPGLCSYQPSPYVVKKRSAPFFTRYVGPSTSVASVPLVASYASTNIAPAPIAFSSVLPSYAAPAYFIKKRSPDLLATRTSYVASTSLDSTYVASTPLVTTYATSILPTAPYYPSHYAGLAGAFPLMKK